MNEDSKYEGQDDEDEVRYKKNRKTKKTVT